MIIRKIIRLTEIIRWKKLKWKNIGKCSVGRFFSVVSPECISLGNGFSFGDNLKLQAWKNYKDDVFHPSITIGQHVTMMENCQISCCGNVTIGDGCLFGSNVFITDNFHGDNSIEMMNIPPIERRLYVKGAVEIGKNVWVGRNVCIMPGVTIGDGAVVGANAVVTGDVAPSSIVAGVPAKCIVKTGEDLGNE